MSKRHPDRRDFPTNTATPSLFLYTAFLSFLLSHVHFFCALALTCLVSLTVTFPLLCMASLPFDAALNEPDTDASHLLLHQLIIANEFDRLSFVTAERYLHAFCNTNLSHIRRRWIGLALAGMIGAAPNVVDHLQPHDLQKLGAIVLSDTELEETRVVAGLAMRQALVHDIEDDRLWASDKVRNCGLNFPKDLDVRWMAKFQDFLDALHSLALTASNNTTSIIYPVSLLSPGEFQWSSSNEGLPVAIIQAGSLTVILPGPNLREIHFLDVPINHICSTQSQQSTLHDSQARTSEYEPWELTLTLQAKPWTYRFNHSTRQGTELTFMFEHSADAKEWESCIKEHQQSTQSSMGPPTLKINPHMSSSSPIKCGGTRRHDRNKEQHATAKVSQAQQEENQSGPAGNSFQLRTTPKSIGQINIGYHHSEISGSRQAEGAASPVQGNGNPAMAGGRGGEASPSQLSDGTTPVNNGAKQIQTQDPSRSVGLISEHNPIFHTPTTGLRSKSATARKGKLPKVSQLAKDRAFRPSPEPAEDIDIAVYEAPGTDRQQTMGPTTMKKIKAKSKQQPKPSKKIAMDQKNSTRDTRSRAKRKAVDDGEYIPDDVRLKNATNASRKSGTLASTSTNKRRKRVNKGASEEMMAMSDEAQVASKEKEDSTIVRGSTRLASKARKPQQTQEGAHGTISSSLKSSKASLIQGLVDSRKPMKPSSATFKKPLRPVQSIEQPSTPTKTRMRPSEPSRQAHTPNVRTHSTDSSRPVFRSSSPIDPTAYESNVWTPHIVAHTEILSSNSKPVPASPNAESTAISGHAHCEEVDLEKKKADVQTAKMDPFQQRRASRKVSSFTRRLTGEGFCGSPKKPIEITSSCSSEFETTVQAITPPHLGAMQWTGEDQQQTLHHKPGLTSLLRAWPRPEHISGDKATTKQLIHNRQSNMPKVSKESEQSRTHTLHEVGRIPAENLLRHTSRTPITDSGARRLRGGTADVPAKHSSLDPQNTTNECVVVAPQQLVQDTQVTKQPSAEHGADLDIDGEQTLINHDGYDESITGFAASSIHFPSSPPIGGSPSSHSSTSADSDVPPTDPPCLNSEAEELEWEASLSPHQRALHDLLIRTSKRVLRHVVDNETAVTDIAEIFERDGEHVLRSLLQRHAGDYEHVFHEMDVKGKSLQHELQDVAKHLANQRKRIRAMV